ncbi:M48 family metalloprotease [Streptomyces clavuligerus]|uniref:Peptidase M48 Ste24p n=1 Tax=Streptomyces clavuligerus TaxID=1901 RepID=D5SJP3_STRCL|nr:M48 family metalloprotease [Streptomyces clavuligerus]EFG04136.1 peptidase M48 Ste24p [Streptomyces clavuligerus]MBY6307383.1 M48 family metalloprotease [Streptomyces clavuligerus]QCS10054.1 LysM peptidoglycan-binding domain-containing protein [Streptomyces clavuligerus]QPJ97902.1 M48 family metalloprotease [Streptomyces clavuligerus]WDN56760.1 M48 family metalloprotease [Streptomyces clavuligerus]
MTVREEAAAGSGGAAVRALLGGVRGLLAVTLLAGFYVMVCTLLLIDAGFVAVTLWGMVETPTRVGSWALVVGGCVPAGFALGYGLMTVSRVADAPPGAVLLRRADAPGLWRLVEELAERLGTRPPGRILLTSEVNASVSEESSMLGLIVGERTMYLGVPLLNGVEPAELRAVLAHELGHYAGRHTRFGAISYRGAESLRSTLFRLRMTEAGGRGVLGYAGLFHGVIAVYAALYLRLTLAVRRRQELEADAEAVAVAGPAATAGALRTVHALDLAWNGFLDRFLRPVQGLGFVPEDVFGTFTAMLEDPEVGERLAERRAHPVESGGSPLDSHPPLVRRLALIEARTGGPPRSAATCGPPPVAGPAPVARVERRLLAESRTGSTALPRERWADLAAEAFAIEPASLLLDAARGVGVTALPTLGTVLDLLERIAPGERGERDGRGERDERGELIRRFTDAPDPGEQVAEALYALTGQALAGAGLARWSLSWTEGYRLDCHRGSGRVLEELTRAAARTPAGVRGLRRELARLGLEVEAPVPLALRTVSAPAGRTMGGRPARRVPEFVAEELRRQKSVGRFTFGTLLVLFALWGVMLVRADWSDPYPSGRTGGAVGCPVLPWAPPSGGPWTGAFPAPGTTPVPDATSLPGLTGRVPLPGPSTSADRAPSWRSPALRYGDLFPRRVPVRPGDTLHGIACRYGTTVAWLRTENELDERDVLRVGAVLTVPRSPQLLTEAGCG